MGHGKLIEKGPIWRRYLVLFRVSIRMDHACNPVQASLTPSLQRKESSWGGEIQH